MISDNIGGVFIQRKSINYLGRWLQSDTRKPLILRGARQVGKSTLVRLFAKERKLKLVEINFKKNNEFNQVFTTLDFSKIISATESKRKEKLDPETTLLFFDEIQASLKS